jgi:hypothetical protein
LSATLALTALGPFPEGTGGNVVSAEVYSTLDAYGVPVLGWISAWALWTVIKTLLRLAGREVSFSHNPILNELPGLPLMLLHSVGFVLAILHCDPLSALIFAWWGPGYLVVAILVVTRGRRVNWQPAAALTSWGCKLSYLILMGLFFYHRCWVLPFAFSVWIMNDQVRLAWFADNGDRTRRTVEDYWLPRVLYPSLLVLPWFCPVPGGVWAGVLGGVLVALWLGGIRRLVSLGVFRTAPDPETSRNLRDIVYLKRPEAPTVTTREIG